MSSIATIGVYILIFVLAVVVLRIPVAYSMGITGLAMFLLIGMPINEFSRGAQSAIYSYTYLALPFFVFAGAIMQYSGISESLIKVVDAIAGRIRASLAIVTILASMAFGVLTGSNIATQSTIGGMMIPAMKKKGYSPEFCAALVAACAFLGTFIPPSVPGIMFAIAAGQKVSDVWLTTIVPGFIFGGGYAVWSLIHCWNVEDKSDLPPFNLTQYTEHVGKQLFNSIPALIMPVIIFGGIYGGIFTAIEAGAVSCLYGICYFIVKKYAAKKEMELSMWQISIKSMGSTAMVCAILVFAKVAGYTFTLTTIASDLATFLTMTITSKFAFLVVLNIILLIEGMFVDLNAGILIMTPLLMPTVQAYGIDPLHFGAILLCNLSIGTITPPMATCLYFGASQANSNILGTIKEIMPFVFVGIISVSILTIFPEIALIFVK